ncbi:NADH-quinone oxidoreductase subunit N [Listeria monocytogenes N53-1]|nr:NADH-quinone oxidoreductase subunit N [Listeria monocytogenes]CCQ22694.1 NADH-quinone oxidoreductase subunit N [Listeria monocytogenes N53-1]
MKYWLPMFGINDGYSAVEVITNWIQANDYSGMIAANTTNKVIRIVTKASQKEGLDETSLVAAANKVKTYGAFDLDRLGYIVRVCYSLDLINEEQAWASLKNYGTLRQCIMMTGMSTALVI